jgi:hypothetical protein
MPFAFFPKVLDGIGKLKYRIFIIFSIFLFFILL